MSAASAVFVVIYLLTIVAGLRTRPGPLTAVLLGTVLLLMVVMLLAAGARSAYGLVVLGLAALIAGPLHARISRSARRDG